MPYAPSSSGILGGTYLNFLKRTDVQPLPVFQVKKKPILTKSKDVPFSTDADPWTCHQ